MYLLTAYEAGSNEVQKGPICSGVCRVLRPVIGKPSASDSVALPSQPAGVTRAVAGAVAMTSLGSAHKVMTTFPLACPVSRYRMASGTMLSA